MSKSLRSMSTFERAAAITRRLASKTLGLGYWAAVDAQNAQKKARSGICEGCGARVKPENSGEIK